MKFKNQIQRLETIFQNRIHIYLSYFNTLYFFEIFFLTILLFFAFGKILAIVCSITLSIGLAYHIVQIYYKSERHRKIQLFLMDIHFAIAIAYFFRLFLLNHPTSFILLFFIIIRIAIAVLEPVFFYFLTNTSIKKIFK